MSIYHLNTNVINDISLFVITNAATRWNHGHNRAVRNWIIANNGQGSVEGNAVVVET